MKLKIIRNKLDNNRLHFTLTGEMTVYSAAKLKNILFKELNSCSGITMDLSGVDEADTSGFQLLIFLKREAALSGKSFSITEMSHRLNSIFTLYKEMV